MVDPIIFIIITILGVSLSLKVTSTQNPVYSGLYLVLLFFLGSGIAFLLGLEFIGLLFLLVYAGAIAVLVLFVVMMLDVKAIENPWSVKKKRVLYFGGLIFLVCLILVGLSDSLQYSIKVFATVYIGSLVFFNLKTYEKYINENFQSLMTAERIFEERKSEKTFQALVNDRIESWYNLCNSESLTEFFRLIFHKENLDKFYGTYNTWFIEFDTSSPLNDISYLLYSTYAILLIIAGIILLIAMVGAITLTLQKNCPEVLYRQLGRESKNAVFLIKEKRFSHFLLDSHLKVSS